MEEFSDEFHDDQQFAAEMVRRKNKFKADVAAVLDYGAASWKVLDTRSLIKMCLELAKLHLK